MDPGRGQRRLTAAAEFLASGRDRQAAELEFAGNAIAMRLGRIYGSPLADGAADVCPYKGLSAFERRTPRRSSAANASSASSRRGPLGPACSAWSGPRAAGSPRW